MVILYINDVDASTFGCSLGNGALEALMAPAPNKAYLQNKSESGHGKQVYVGNKMPALKDERTVTIKLNVQGRSQEDMMANFRTLTGILDSGKVDIRTSMEEGLVYHLLYESCNQLQTFFRGYAIFSIRFNEPNPNNRQYRNTQE